MLAYVFVGDQLLYNDLQCHALDIHSLQIHTSKLELHALHQYSACVIDSTSRSSIVDKCFSMLLITDLMLVLVSCISKPALWLVAC